MVERLSKEEVESRITLAIQQTYGQYHNPKMLYDIWKRVGYTLGTALDVHGEHDAAKAIMSIIELADGAVSVSTLEDYNFGEMHQGSRFVSAALFGTAINDLSASVNGADQHAQEEWRRNPYAGHGLEALADKGLTAAVLNVVKGEEVARD